jgi:hypothetical protein
MILRDMISYHMPNHSLDREHTSQVCRHPHWQGEQVGMVFWPSRERRHGQIVMPPQMIGQRSVHPQRRSAPRIAVG